MDGANCPSADVSTPQARTSAYSQLLNLGLIRMTLPVPANADFSIIAISDPYQCPETTATQPALYRRPLPSTNLRFLNGIMWDGREPDLQTQAKDATLVHTQPDGPPTDAQLQQIVDLETSTVHRTVGRQSGRRPHRTGREWRSAVPFAPQPFSVGINSGPQFNPNAFTLYTSWTTASGTNAAAQQSIARGEMLFNNFPFRISQRAGI